jgi:hypothetical protein
MTIGKQATETCLFSQNSHDFLGYKLSESYVVGQYSGAEVGSHK